MKGTAPRVAPRFTFLIATIVLLLVPAFAGESVSLVCIGTTSSNGHSMPLWALQVGNPSAAEANSSDAGRSLFLGPNTIDGVIWIRQGEERDVWIRAVYIRPHSVDEFLDFIDRPANFRVRSLGGNEILPLPFSILPGAELSKVDYIVVYFHGGMKAYLSSGTSRDEAAQFLKSYRVAEATYIDSSPNVSGGEVPWPE